jgi:hypothetical protein
VGRKYPVISGESGIDIAAGRLDGYSIKLENAGIYIQSPALTADSTFIIGLAIKFVSLVAADRGILYLYDGATAGMSIIVTTTGELAVYRGATLLDTTVGLGLLGNTWYYLEFKVVCGNAPDGSYELRVGETTVLSDSGIDTQAGSNAYHDAFRLNNAATTPLDPFYDDIYVCDGSGTINNDFLGNMKVVSILPDGVGNSADFTPSAGANFTCVDEEVIDDDTSYVESGTSGHKDTHSFADLSSVIGVKGIQINTTCRETDASSFSLVTVIRSDGTDYSDTPQAIGTTDYITKILLSETDPATTDPWLYSAINSAEFGYEVD